MKFMDMPKNQGLIGTIVGEDTQIKGEIRSSGSLRIDGCLDGNADVGGEVYIGEKSAVKGNVSGKKIVVAGQVNGNVSSVESVEIRKNGKIFGDISGNTLIVNEGASYKGRVTMGEAKNMAEDKNPAEEFSDKVKEIIGL